MKSGPIDSLDYDDVRLLSRVLDLYYVQEMTQAQVGRQLGLSTAKVNRLLKQARREGMVEITIRTPFQRLFDLEARLKAIFGLAEAVIIPRVAEDPASFVRTLGRAGAKVLLESIGDGDVIAVGGGTAVSAVVHALDVPRAYDVTVVPMLGGVQGQVFTDVNYLAAELAERLGGKAYQLHAPAFVYTPEHRDAIMAMGPIKEILDIARRANVALLGVGALEAGRSRFVDFTALSPEDMERIAAECGGVGEVLAHVYNIEGQPCADEVARRVVALTLQELEQIPLVVGVAATTSKALPIYGALRGGFLNTLITDEAAASQVLGVVIQQAHGQSAGGGAGEGAT